MLSYILTQFPFYLNFLFHFFYYLLKFFLKCYNKKQGDDIMRIFVCDAFSSEIFKGNQAGVVILDEKENYPDENFIK